MLFFLSLSACSHDEAMPTLESLHPNDVVLAFGDSLTVGKGATPDKSYPAQLQKLIKRRVIRAGVPGEVSVEGLARLPKELSRHRPALLIICHGGNDALRRQSPQQTYNNIKQMVQIARKQGVSVVLLGVPTFSLMLSAPKPASLYDQLAAKLKLPYERHALSELFYDNRYKSDSIHLNAAGYKKLAEAVAKLLKKTGAI